MSFTGSGMICRNSRRAVRGSLVAGAVLFCFVAGLACGKKADPRLPLQVAPKAVRKLQAAVRHDAALLLWKAPEKNTDDSPLLNLGGFEIFREEVPADEACRKCPRNFIKVFDHGYQGPRGAVPEGDWLRYYDRDLKIGCVYFYKVRAYSRDGVSGPSSKTLTVYYQAAPEPPRALSVQRQGRLLRLTWRPPARFSDGAPLAEADLLGYNLYRSEQPAPQDQMPLNQEILAGTAFEDVPERQDVTYFYAVRALRKVPETLIESLPSEAVAVDYMDTTPPGVPRGLTAVPSAEGVLLKWIPKTESDFAGFNLYRKAPHEGEFKKLNQALIRGSSWLDRTAVPRRQYRYGVTSVDRSKAGNESGFSETVDVNYVTQ